MFGPIAFVGAVALIAAILWLAHQGHRRLKRTRRQFDADCVRLRQQDELGAMILAAQSYRQEQDYLRTQADYEAQL